MSGLKCLRGNCDSRVQPRRGGLNLAQDVSPGNTSSNSASPVGTAETAGNGFSRPYGTRHLSSPNPGLTSRATLSRPCETDLVIPGPHAACEARTYPNRGVLTQALKALLRPGFSGNG